MVADEQPPVVVKTRCNHVGPKGGACPKWASVDSSTCAKHTGINTAAPAGAAVAAATYQVCESPPLNIGMATELANTRDFGAIKPWGHMPVHEVINIIKRRVHRSKDGFGFTIDVYRESSNATKAGCAMRLQAGWKQVFFFILQQLQ